MSHLEEQKFIDIVNNTCEDIKNTLGKKAGEYSRNGDRLHNFNQIARVNELPVEVVIWGMASKHLSCVLDMVHGLTVPDDYMVNEKIGDMINYLIILKAHFLNELELQGVREMKTKKIGDSNVTTK